MVLHLTDELPAGPRIEPLSRLLHSMHLTGIEADREAGDAGQPREERGRASRGARGRTAVSSHDPHS